MSDLATDVNALRPVRAYLRTSGAPYLSVLLLSVVLSQFAQYLAPTQVILKGQPAGVVTKTVLVSAAVLLWLMFKPTETWPPIFRWFLASLALMWLMTITLSVAHGDLFNMTAFLAPVAIAMIWLKKPSLKATFIAGDAFAWSVVAIAAAAQLIDSFGIKLLHYEGWNRWPLLTDFIGPIPRWEGPFGNVNFAGPIGAYLIVYGIFRLGIQRFVFVLCGAVIVFASDSRGSVLAVCAGLVTAILVKPVFCRIRIPKSLRIAAPVVLLCVFISYVVGADPTFNGRTEVWSSYFENWVSNPIIGIGGAGIDAATVSGDLPLVATHGHNIFVDPLLRYGATGAVVVILVISIAVLIATRSGINGWAVGPAIMATSMVSGLNEDLVEWRYLSIAVVPIVLAAMLGAHATGSMTRIGVANAHRPNQLP